jgi:Tfp pilus assembly protein PilV
MLGSKRSGILEECEYVSEISRRRAANGGFTAAGPTIADIGAVLGPGAPSGGAPRARLLRKRARCAGQASLTEVLVAVLILTIVIFGVVCFLLNGRVMVEGTGEGIIAAQIAQEHLDRTRSLAYSSIASSKGTETVGGLVYTWVLTVTTAQADPADPNSKFLQTGVTVTWPTGQNAKAAVYTAIGQ